MEFMYSGSDNVIIDAVVVRDGQENRRGSDAHHIRKGMGWIVTGLFIVGEMAGGGIVALPYALFQSSWIGVSFLFVGAITSAYTGVQLGECWTILQDFWPEYRHPTRKPYPAIGERAFGKWAKHAVSFCIDATLFGAAVVFLLVAADNIHSLASLWSHNMSQVSACVWILIVAAVLWPITFLGTPKDFWPLAVFATASTSIASVFIIIGAFLDSSKQENTPVGTVSFTSTFLGFATIIFAYGGHSAFPTIQHDMREPRKFSYSVGFAYLIIVMLYVPVALVCFLVYKDTVQGNVLNNITTPWCRSLVTSLITLHLLSTFIIIMCPINLEVEDVFNVPHSQSLTSEDVNSGFIETNTRVTPSRSEFLNRIERESQRFAKRIGGMWKRLLIRSVTMAAVVFVAESVPQFGYVLNLIGASTISALTFVFPGLFYIALNRKLVHRTLPWYEMMATTFIVVLGFIGGIAATYSAISSIVHDYAQLGQKPCYLS